MIVILLCIGGGVCLREPFLVLSTENVLIAVIWWIVFIWKFFRHRFWFRLFQWIVWTSVVISSIAGGAVHIQFFDEFISFFSGLLWWEFKGLLLFHYILILKFNFIPLALKDCNLDFHSVWFPSVILIFLFCSFIETVYATNKHSTLIQLFR